MNNLKCIEIVRTQWHQNKEGSFIILSYIGNRNKVGKHKQKLASESDWLYSLLNYTKKP